MLVIGEKINSTLKGITPSLESRNAEFFQQLARDQVEAGAGMLDVNAGTREQAETEDLVWLVKTVQEAVDVPLCLDSPNPDALEAALRVHRGKALINSVTGEKDRLNAILPLVKKYDAAVVALAHGKEGISRNAADRFAVARDLVDVAAGEFGIPVSDIFVDPLVLPVSVDTTQALACLETIRLVKNGIPGVKTVSGLSNVSYGLPLRKYINHMFLVMGMQVGLDAAILDPLDAKLMANLKIAQVLLGQDEDCRRYLKAHRKGQLRLEN
jgi:cobalamin-dependent methionine synthase I